MLPVGPTLERSKEFGAVGASAQNPYPATITVTIS